MKSIDVCIIDESKETCEILEYFIDRMMVDKKIHTFTNPSIVDVNRIKECSLIIISEIMDDITGTEFVGKLYDSYFLDELPNFPKILFLSNTPPEYILDQLQYEDILNKIPSYRVAQKPISPKELKDLIISLCPILASHIRPYTIVPKLLTPNEAFFLAVNNLFTNKKSVQKVETI